MTPTVTIQTTRRIALLATGTAALAATTGTATAHAGSGFGGMMGGWGLLGGGMLLWPLLLVGLVALIALFARRPATGRSDRAMVELRERYARGDLSEEEFDRRRAVLDD